MSSKKSSRGNSPAKKSDYSDEDKANDGTIYQKLTLKKGTNLFIANLSGSMTERDIEKLYKKYGEVKLCRIIKDPKTGYNVIIFFLT